MSFEAVLFDLDNTLADRTAAFRRWAESFSSDRLVISSASGRRAAAVQLIEWDRSGDVARADLFERVVTEWPQIGKPVPDLVAEYETAYPQMFRPDRRVIELVRALDRRGIKWGIVTNGGRTQRPKIERIGLAGMTGCIVVSTEVGLAKPERRIFDLALEKLGSPDRRRTLFVGDHPTLDIEGGKGAGLATAWVSSGATWPPKFAAPDYMVEHVSEIRPLLGV